MTSVRPDPDTEFGTRVASRLRDEPVAWLTVVDAAGTPQPTPVWFLWDDGSALVYSRADAKRLDHIRANARVALHLDGNGQGGDIVVVTGDAEVRSDEPPAHENPAFAAKYGSRITGGPWGSVENFAAQYPVPIRIRARRLRGH